MRQATLSDYFLTVGDTYKKHKKKDPRDNVNPSNHFD